MKKSIVFKLQNLIQKLKKEEKRSFKLVAKKYHLKEGNIYIKIFDYLNKSEKVNEQKFKHTFKQVKGLNAVQHYLYEQIMKSLRLRKKEKQEVATIILEGLIDLEILYKKDLIDLVQDKLEELLEVAKFYDQVTYLPLLYDWWFKLGNTKLHYYETSLEEGQAYIDNYKKAINDLDLYATYKTQMCLFLIHTSHHNARQANAALKEIRDNVPTYYSPQEPSNNLLVIFQELQLKKHIAIVLGKNKEAYKLTKQTATIIEQRPPSIIEFHKKYYLAALYSLMTNAPTVEEAATILKKVLSFTVEKNLEIDTYLMIAITIAQLDIYFELKQFEACKLVIEEKQNLIRALQQTDTALTVSAVWFYRVAMYYFAMKNYSETIVIIDEELQNKAIPTIIRQNSALLKIIIYYEQNEYDFLYSAIRNLRRSLKKEASLLGLEQLVLSMITKLINSSDAEKELVFIKFKEKMITYFSTCSAHEKECLLFFDYISWIDSQINKELMSIFYYRHFGVIPY